MKITAATTIAATFATFAAATASAATNADHPSLRQLQFFPPPFNQPGTGATEADPAIAGNWNTNGVTTAGNEADAATDATAATTTATSDPAMTATAPQGATSGSATGTTAAAAATAPSSSDIAPGQPTIMVILPDFLAAHSGWSSYTDDVGETTDKKDAKPAGKTPASDASVDRAPSRVLAAVTLAVAVAAAAFA